MTDYANCRFKSNFFKAYKVPKSAREYEPPSNPFCEHGVKPILPSSRSNQIRLQHKTMIRAESKIKPEIFDKVANNTDFTSLGRPYLTTANKAKEYEPKIITQQGFQRAGTISTSTKPIPLV